MALHGSMQEYSKMQITPKAYKNLISALKDKYLRYSKIRAYKKPSKAVAVSSNIREYFKIRLEEII